MNDAMDVNTVQQGILPGTLVDNNRHAFCLGVAQAAAAQSLDPSTQVGCVFVTQTSSPTSNEPRFVVLAMGYNRFPDGVEPTPERLHSRPDKYMFTVHAERNALNQLLRNTMLGGPAVPMPLIHAYIWGMTPCTECVKDLVDAGIRHVFYHVGNSTPAARERYAIGPTSQAIINEAVGGLRVVDLSHITPASVRCDALSEVR